MDNPNASDFLSGALGGQGTLATETPQSGAPVDDQTSDDEGQGTEIPDAQESDSADGEGKSASKATKATKAPTHDDIRKLQSTYDKRIAGLEKQLKSANDALMQTAIQQAQIENAVFEANIQHLPPDQQALQRDRFQATQRAAIEKAQREAEKANMQKVLDSLAPLARERVAMDIAQEYGIPVKELLDESLKSPAEMTAAAKQIARFTKKEGTEARTQARKERKQDVFEGTGLGATSVPDLKKQLQGSGKLQDYLRATDPRRKRK